MALDKIKQANKKARREMKRKKIRQEIAGVKQSNKVRRKRARKMFVEGRREYQEKRRSDKAYIDALEAELKQ